MSRLTHRLYFETTSQLTKFTLRSFILRQALVRSNNNIANSQLCAFVICKARKPLKSKRDFILSSKPRKNE